LERERERGRERKRERERVSPCDTWWIATGLYEIFFHVFFFSSYFLNVRIISVSWRLLQLAGQTVRHCSHSLLASPPSQTE
jgi:hypothetical protein